MADALSGDVFECGFRHRLFEAIGPFRAGHFLEVKEGFLEGFRQEGRGLEQRCQRMEIVVVGKVWRGEVMFLAAKSDLKWSKNWTRTSLPTSFRTSGRLNCLKFMPFVCLYLFCFPGGELERPVPPPEAFGSGTGRGVQQ